MNITGMSARYKTNMADSTQPDVKLEELIQRLSTAVQNNNEKTRDEIDEVLKLEDQLHKRDRKAFKRAKKIQCLKAIRLKSLPLLRLLFSKDYVFLKDQLDSKTNQTFMCKAIQADFLEGLKYLVDNGLKLESEPGEKKWIALFQAVEYGKPRIVDFLLKEQPNHVHSTLYGMTLVGLACKTCNFGVLRLLLHSATATFDLNIQDTMNDHIPFIMAARDNFPDIVKYFIENGADLTSYDSQKNTALHYLCQHPETKDSLDCIQRLGKQIKIDNCLHILDSKNVHDRTPLYIAVTSGNLKAVDMLVGAGCDVNVQCLENNEPILSIAIIMNTTKTLTSNIVTKLIIAGSNVNASDKSGKTPLMTTVSLKDRYSIKLLIQHGADVTLKDCDGHNLIDYCFMYSNPAPYNRTSDIEVLEYLKTVDARFRIEDISEESLDRILANDDADTLGYLISNGLDIHHIGKNNRNILHLLSEHTTTTRFNKIKPYCDEADVNQQDSDGDTPLMYVANKEPCCGPLLINYFLERGADVNLRNKKGQTALMGFATENNKEILTLLIDAGSDVNIRAQDGRTAMQFLEPYSKNPYFKYDISHEDYKDCLILLLKNGGSPSLDYKDLKGFTPFQYVLETKRVSFMWYLITQNCSFSSVSDRGEKLKLCQLKLAKIFYHSGAPKQLILDIFQMGDGDKNKFKSFCGTLRLSELCRRQIRVSIGPGIQEKLQNSKIDLKIAPNLIRFICLMDLIHLKWFDINSVYIPIIRF